MLPLIPIGLGLLAMFGAKKGLDAKSDFDDAKEYNADAEKVFNKAQKKLTKARDKTNSDLELLGIQKELIYKNTFVDFITIFSKIKNIDFEDNLKLGTKIPLDYQEMLDMKESILKINEILGGGLVAAGGGAAAGFGAFGGVGILATASTGTAIGTLSGAAATNATLAWLGGGSLASGGMGMAGGTAILGGIVVAPVLLIGGMILASKAEEAKDEARSNFYKAESQAEEMDTAKIVVKEISLRVNEINDILISLNEILIKHINKLNTIVNISTDYRTYKNYQKKIVMIVSSIASTTKNICDAPIIDENGKVTKKSREVLNMANEFVKKLEAV